MKQEEKLGLKLQRMSEHERDDWRRSDPAGFQLAVENRRATYRDEVAFGKNTNISSEMMTWLEASDPATLTTTRAAITRRDNAKAKADADRAAKDTATVAENLGGKSFAASLMEWADKHRIMLNGESCHIFSPEHWMQDCEKIMAEANQQKVPLDYAHLDEIIKNLAHAGELNLSSFHGELLSGYELMHYDLLNDLLRPANQRRDFRTAEEFLKTDPAILAENKRIDEELLMRDLDAEFRRLAKTETSFNDTQENRQALFEYCRTNDLPLRQESLAAAFREMWSKGLIGKIPNVDVRTGVTSARISPEPWRDESDEANEFRRSARKMTAQQYDAAMEDPLFRERADKWL